MEKQFIEKMQKRVAGAIEKSGTNARTFLTNITDSEGTKFYGVGVELGVHKALDNLQQLDWLNDGGEDIYNLADLAQTYYTLDFTFNKLSNMTDDDIVKEIETLKIAYENSLFFYIPNDCNGVGVKINYDEDKNLYHLFIEDIVLIFDEVGQQIGSAIYVPADDELVGVEFTQQVAARVNDEWVFVD